MKKFKHLTEKDYNEISRLNAQMGWHVTNRFATQMINKHKKYRAEGNEYEMEFLEYRMIDYNFLGIAEAMREGDYKWAKESIDRELVKR